MLMRYFTIFLNFFAGRLLNNDSSLALADMGLKKIRKAALSLIAAQATLILFTVALLTFIADLFYISKTQGRFALSEFGYVSGALLLLSTLVTAIIFRKKSWKVSELSARPTLRQPQKDSALSQALALLVVDMVEERRFARQAEPHVVPEKPMNKNNSMKQTFAEQYSENEAIEAMYN